MQQEIIFVMNRFRNFNIKRGFFYCNRHTENNIDKILLEILR